MPQRRLRAAVVACAAAACALATVPGAASATPIEPEYHCTPTDSGLAELSGLVSLNGALYAIGDSGADDRLAVFGADCEVERWLDVPADRYDVEDLSAYDGSLWLADTGDNQKRRETVALISMDPTTGVGELHRLTYPDGAHDAETLLIESSGRPVIVTKELSGVSGVYVPAGDESVTALSGSVPTPMRRVGDLGFTATETVGGPPFVVGSILATGGAVNADRTVAVVRTYTDAYLFRSEDGDLASALVDSKTPRTVLAVPNQPQGEAVTFLDDGTLLVASEAGFGAAEGALPPILEIADTTGPAPSTPEAAMSHPNLAPAATASDHRFRAGVAAGVLLLVAAAGFALHRSMRHR